RRCGSRRCRSSPATRPSWWAVRRATCGRWRSRSPSATAPPTAGRSPPDGMIAVEGLVKTYGSFTAVDGVSLEVAPGEIHGFLGPNGAGKTTTIRIIAGLLKPTRGRVTISGHDLAAEPEAAKASLGFIPRRPFIY